MLWMQLTEEEAAVIKRLARNRHHDLTVSPNTVNVEAEKTVLRAISDKAMSVSYASSVRHTLGADALTPEAASYIKQELEHLNDAHGSSWFKIRDGLDAVLQPYGLTLEALKYEPGCGIALIGEKHG